MSTRMKGINPYDKVYDGVYRAIVEALPGSDGDDHPELGRVRVRIPSIHGEVEDVQLLPWARPCTLGAFSGDSRGTFNLPDLGDIIWVMFEAGNYQYPVYLGGTTSSHSLSAETVMENKGQKSTAVTLYTENGNMIQYTRKDGSECYTITLEDKSITVDKTGIHIQGDTDITGNLTVNGDLNVSGSGSIGSELSVGGELKVADDAYFNKDIHVSGTTYTSCLILGGSEGVFLSDGSGQDKTLMDAMTEEEYQELIGGIGAEPGSFLYYVQLAKIEMAKQGISYDQSGYVDLVIDGKTYHTRTDCSGLVSTMVKAYTGSTTWQTTNSTGFVTASGIPGFVKVTDGSLQAGDICARNGHVEVYAYRDSAGKDHVYSGGSTASLNNPGEGYAGAGGYDTVWRPIK